MTQAQPSKSERMRERQPISVPFIWEEKPGMPKKDWKPFTRPVEPPAPPVKFVVSVPFGWEEKPGTPFPSFVQPQKEESQMVFFSSPPKHSITSYGGNDDYQHENEEDEGSSESEPPAPPAKLVVSVPFGWEEKPGTPHPSFVQPPNELQLVVFSDSIYGGNDDDQRDNEGDDDSSESELDTCSVTTDESFTSAKSLLANGLISTAAIANAVPVQQTSLALVTTDSTMLQCPGSPASETDSTCSYATGTTSLAGASFLEWLFPRLVPNSNVSNRIGYLETTPSQKADVQTKEYQHGSNCIQTGRPLLTLGDLIAMSRRRSCQRKVNKMHKQQSMDFMKRNAFACCIFGTGNEIHRLSLKWKRQLQLKLM